MNFMILMYGNKVRKIFGCADVCLLFESSLCVGVCVCVISCWKVRQLIVWPTNQVDQSYCQRVGQEIIFFSLFFPPFLLPIYDVVSVLLSYFKCFIFVPN